MTTVLADPAADVRHAIAAQEGVPELDGKNWFHRTAAAVIEPERCVGCAACIASCPSGSIGIGDDGRPTLVRMCTGCSSCWDVCPLAGLRTERLHRLLQGGEPAGPLGAVRTAYDARARLRTDGAQDGGVVTSLLAALLERGLLDGAILTRRIDAFRGESVLATTPDEVRACAGSVYDQSFPLARLAEPMPAGVERLALVGTPCQITAFRALERFPWPLRPAAIEAVTLTIALFCTRSFQPSRLRAQVKRRGVDPRTVRAIDVRDGMLTARDENGVLLLEAPAGELAAAGMRGCDECDDLTGHAADISAGNLATEAGRTTILVRTANGEQAWAAALDALEAQPLADVEPLVRADSRNRRHAHRHLRRSHAPEGPLWISYREHLDAYAGSDRAPLPPPPHRTHHYRVSC